MTMYGIDISEHQTRLGMPDFEAVKASGKDFVIIRVGWGGYAGPIDIDDYLDEVIRTAIKAGLHVGLYVYSYNRNVEAAKLTANEICNIADQYKIDFPIFYDVEECKDPCLLEQGRARLTETVIAFLKQVEVRGYYASWYSYTSFIATALDYNKLKAYDLWLADYRGLEKPPYPCGMYQYTVTGTTGPNNVKGKDYFTEGVQPGIIGNCDQNVAFKDYPSIIKRAGLNGFKKPAEPKPKPVENEMNYKEKYLNLRADIEKLLEKYEAL